MKPFMVKLVSSKEEFLGRVSAGECYFKYGAISSTGFGEVVKVTESGAWVLKDNYYCVESGRGGGIVFKEEQNLFERVKL